MQAELGPPKDGICEIFVMGLNYAFNHAVGLWILLMQHARDVIFKEVRWLSN